MASPQEDSPISGIAAGGSGGPDVPRTEGTRFYRKELPQEEELVVVRVEKVKDFEAFVALLAYNNIEGMILLSEVSRRRIRSIHKHLRVGKQDVMQVLRVDREKKYVDLSKKYVTPEDSKRVLDEFAKAKTVHSIMKHVSQLLNVPLIELQEKVSWRLMDEYPGDPLTGMARMCQDPKILDPIDLAQEVKDAILKETRHRLAEKPVKIVAQIDVSCFTKEGIEAVKAALREGQAIKRIEKEIKARNGSLAIKDEPQASENN